ncbi:MAG: 16S rRNA (guanine(527)-N(7))-methyltransferase RsmG [Nitriliruptoraceae bacterium]
MPSLRNESSSSEDAHVEVSDDQLRVLDLIATAIETAPHNLMSRRGIQDLRIRHLPECVAFARMLPAGPARVLDIGSGGGLPGLIIAAIRSDLEVHLLDSTAKKTAFLDATSHDLGIPATVHTMRAEDFARGPHADSFDIVTARAVAALEQLVEWSVPLMKAGGLLFAIKGERWSDELDAAASTLRRWRVHLVATPDDQLSRADAEPRVVILARGT